MKKLAFIVAIAIFLVSCGTTPFEGKITYEGQAETVLHDKFGIADKMLGQLTNSEIDLYVKGGKVAMKTEADNPYFGSFKGAFKRVVYDLDNQKAYYINDETKSYAVESLLESSIEGFNFKTMKSELAETKANLGEVKGNQTIQGYECKVYIADGTLADNEVALSEVLMNELEPTIRKIEGLHDYDFAGLGFPLNFKTEYMGMVGMNYTATKIEKKVLDDALFSVDGYTEVNTLEYYQQNLANPLESLGLTDQVEGLIGEGGEILNDLTKQGLDKVSEWGDSLSNSLEDIGNQLEDLFNFSE